MGSATPVRREAEDAVHSSLLPSACPDDELAAHARTDPYWDPMWAPGSQGFWTTAKMVRQLRAGTLGGKRSRSVLDQDDALRLLTGHRGRLERLAAWGALQSWRTLSAEQLATLTGSRYFLDPDYSTIAASFALDLLDIGLLANYANAAPGLTRNAIYRPSNSDAFERLIEPDLTGPEWLSVTAGQQWSSGGQYDRHNLLAAELGLRAAEYLPVGAVLGERLSSIDLLAGSGLGKKLPRKDNRRADGTIVRDDGMRIAIELTATASTGFETKVRKWARLLSERPLETSGLTVLFIASPHPDRPRHTSADPVHEIYRRLAQVLREFPGTGADSPAARMGIAHWQDYFPGRHLLSEAFFSLRAEFAVSHAAGAEKWVPRDLLGDYAFEPWHTFDATAVIENSKLLGATPHWMRAGDHTHLVGTPMDRAGEPVPHPAPARPQLVKGRPLGAGIGNAGDTKLPRRLRIEW